MGLFKYSCVLVFLIFGFALFQETNSVGPGPSPFTGVNVDRVLANSAMVQRHINCLKCTGPCDRIGSELKRVLPIVASNNCRTCSQEERVNLGKIVSHAQQKYPQDWQEINSMMTSGRRC